MKMFRDLPNQDPATDEDHAPDHPEAYVDGPGAPG